MFILTILRKNINSDEVEDPSYAKIVSCQAILGQKPSKMVNKSIFEVHKSNTTRPLGPPRGSILLVLTFLRENIDSDELGDPSYAKIVSCQAILGPKPYDEELRKLRRDVNCGDEFQADLDPRKISLLEFAKVYEGTFNPPGKAVMDAGFITRPKELAKFGWQFICVCMPDVPTADRLKEDCKCGVWEVETLVKKDAEKDEK